jgi:3-phytase
MHLVLFYVRSRSPAYRRASFDTADFHDETPGNLRVDYVLPLQNLTIVDAAVFWPESSAPLFPLVGTFAFPSSDHRLVWIDVVQPQ